MLAPMVLVAALIALLYFQFMEWRSFQWDAFLRQTARANFLWVAAGVVFIYAVYALRALRWKLLLKPTCDVPFRRLLPPTVIGFTGLALLGRPGEFVRPYLIARREKLSVTSQMAVWWVERIFDAAAFTLLVGLSLRLAPGVRALPHFAQIQRLGLVFLALVVAMVAGALLLRYSGEGIAGWTERVFGRAAPRAAHKVAAAARSFRQGLDTIHDFRTFAQLLFASIAIWSLIALSYLAVLWAYPPPLAALTLGPVMLLLAATTAGSLIQLPAVGGGPQIALITVLVKVFATPTELAVSCGIMIWLVTFMAIVPLGLVMARREHVSIRRLSHEAVPEEA